MGSRALSYDSVFLSDQVLTGAEPARVLSQENVHGKIKALQVQAFIHGIFLKLGFTNVAILKTLHYDVIDEASATEAAFGAATYGSADQKARRC